YCSVVKFLNGGMGEPGFTQLGHIKWLIWNWIPRPFAPSALRSGAPRFGLPAPRYVWQPVHPACAKILAPSSPFAERCCSLTHWGTLARFSAGRASFAVAPL